VEEGRGLEGNKMEFEHKQTAQEEVGVREGN